MSGYEHNFHDCEKMQHKHGCHQDGCDKFGTKWRMANGTKCMCRGDIKVGERWARDPAVADVVDYAQCVGNCTVNMLTGRLCGAGGYADVETAVGRIPKLGFVGITEEWNLTVCLFHTRFGGPILASELLNVRPGILKGSQANDATTLANLKTQAKDLLQAWPATGELRVYEAARARFDEELQKFRVSRQSCQETLESQLR